MPVSHTHLGIYGLIIEGDAVVLILKARGPYRGMWDLPGGGLEFGESPKETLERELQEETALHILHATPLDALSVRFTHTLPEGIDEDLHHIGIVYKVTVKSLAPLKAVADGEDSLGSKLFHLDEVDSLTLTPFAKYAVDSLKAGG